MMIGMATERTTLSLDTDALAFARRAAARKGVSLSAWLSRAARQEAIREGYTGPQAAADPELVALADEDEAATAEQEWRAAG